MLHEKVNNNNSSSIARTPKSTPIAILKVHAPDMMSLNGHAASPTLAAIRENSTGGSGDMSVDDGDVLWPLPGSRDNLTASPLSLSQSPSSSSGGAYLTAAHAHRQRAHTMDTGAYTRPRSAQSSVVGLRQVPKDPIQPKHGSIQDIHSPASSRDDDGSEAGEEEDVFAELPRMRPRSNTCPANLTRARRNKLRSLRRPPTPPPMDLIEPCGGGGASDVMRAHSSHVSAIKEEQDFSTDRSNGISCS